ncbi:hypothetical protein N9R79_07265 [Vibrio sp.]|nr:hypothetical protein [Vibrio sp.]
MKKSFLALSLAAICGYSSAQPFVISDVQLDAYEAQGYIKVVYLLKKDADLSIYGMDSLQGEILNKSLVAELKQKRSPLTSLEDRLSRYRTTEFSAENYDAAKNQLDNLSNDPRVELAYIASPAVNLDTALETNSNDVQAVTVEKLEDKQTHLNGVNTSGIAPGINAKYAWTIPGGTGQGVKVVTLEQGAYHFEHDDLPSPAFIAYNNPEMAHDHLFRTHDTSSAGLISAFRDDKGVTGIAYNAQLAWAQFNDGAMLSKLANQLPKGSVIQLGVQSGGSVEFGAPPELMPAVYDAITYLVQEKGIHVIQAAGNSEHNLDDPKFNGQFDRAVRDSGAIYAGASLLDGSVAGFSSYGSRIDLNALGANVVTTASGEDEESIYTENYGGTSSANPILAGSVAAIQGILNHYNLTYTPVEVRDVLVQTGDKHYQGDRELGVKPNLQSAIDFILEKEGITPDQAIEIRGPKAVKWGQSLTLNALLLQEVTGSSFEWAQTSGEPVQLNANGSEITIDTATLSEAAQTLTFSVTAKDQSGITISQQVVDIDVTVMRDISFSQESVNYGEVHFISPSVGNTSAQYYWEKVGGVGTENLSYMIAPDGSAIRIDAQHDIPNDDNAKLSFRVTATDKNTGLTVAQEVVDFTVNEKTHTTTFSGATDVEFNTANVNYGDSVEVIADITPNNYPRMDYLWFQESGEDVGFHPEFGLYGPTLSFDTADLSDIDQSLTFRLRVENQHQAKIWEEVVTVNVKKTPVSEPITGTVAVSGATSIDHGDAIALTATATTNPVDATVNYEWTQTSGATVSFSANTATLNASTASLTNANQTLGFEVSITDVDGNVLDTEQVTVTINEVSTGGGDIPVWVAGQTDPETGDIVSHNGSCWEAQNNPGSWEEPREGWFWTEVECQ